MTDTDTQVATERMVIRHPAGIGDENTGMIVAPGDPLPAGAGIISNTPNKVDAAANYEEADAADKAGSGARPATRVVQEASPERQAQLEEIQERVAENTNAWEQESKLHPPTPAAPKAERKPAAKTTTKAPEPPATDAFNPKEATGKQLDERYAAVEGYPKRQAVAKRQAWAAKYEASQR